MKKVLKVVAVIVLLAGVVSAWIFLGSGTGFSAEKKYLYISSNGTSKEAILDSLKKNEIVSNIPAFSFLASRMGYWDAVKPGRYEVTKGSSLLTIVRLLRNGQQKPVDLIITKLRTKEDFAKLTGAKFEFDSAQMIAYLNSGDSLKNFDADTANALWLVMPDKYQFFWNSTPSIVYRRLYNESKKFWNDERTAKAKALNLQPKEVYTLASIIEEETTNHQEKDTIASVYLNRLRTGMPLQADPTLKFAVRNFALKRVAGDMLRVASAYNTYQNKGLPPGPICTPSKITIEAVLNPAQTDYFFFVANSKLKGHLFSRDFTEHVEKANRYREEDKKRRERDSLLKAK